LKGIKLLDDSKKLGFCSFSAPFVEVSSQQTTAKRLNDTTTAAGCELGIPLSDQEIPAVQSSIRSPSLLKELRCTFCLKIDEGVSNSLSMSSIHRQVEEILSQLHPQSRRPETETATS